MHTARAHGIWLLAALALMPRHVLAQEATPAHVEVTAAPVVEVTAAPVDEATTAPVDETTTAPDDAPAAPSADETAEMSAVATTTSLTTTASTTNANVASTGSTQEHGDWMLRVQLEPGVISGSQNGPLPMSFTSLGASGSVALGLKIAKSTAIGVEAWVGLALLPSMRITAPTFAGGEEFGFREPSLLAMFVGPNLTQVFSRTQIAVSISAGIAFASFDYGSYDYMKLPYNRQPDENGRGVKSPIPVDKTTLGFGLAISIEKQLHISDGMWLGFGVQLRPLIIPDSAVYFDYSDRGNLRYHADYWYIGSIGAHASLMIF